jgi:hypothetical protein
MRFPDIWQPEVAFIKIPAVERWWYAVSFFWRLAKNRGARAPMRPLDPRLGWVVAVDSLICMSSVIPTNWTIICWLSRNLCNIGCGRRSACRKPVHYSEQASFGFCYRKAFWFLLSRGPSESSCGVHRHAGCAAWWKRDNNISCSKWLNDVVVPLCRQQFFRLCIQ